MKYNLCEYKNRLSSLNMVRENHIPYMIGWVKYYHILGDPDDAEFADVLFREGRKDWQIRQALDSVKIYREMYPSTSVLNDNSETPLHLMRKRLKVRHYARSTEKTYVQWCSRYLVYCEKNEISAESDSAFKAFISHLALKKRVASSTQNQAFNAILFLFRNVWSREPENIDAVRARKSSRMPVVLSLEEVSQVLRETRGLSGLVIRLIYSSGLRLSEALRLRVKDIDLKNRSITVRSGKGDKDRITIISLNIIDDLRKQLENSRELYERSIIPVSLPAALEKKYPNAGLEWKWQYYFPARNASVNPITGEIRRHHLHQTGIQKSMRKAVKEAGIKRHTVMFEQG